MNHILIDIVLERLPFVFPIPLESFIGGIKNRLAPTVEDHNLKIRNQVLRSLRKGENVVHTIRFRWSDGIGEIEGNFRDSNRDRDMDNAVTAIDTLVGD